METNTLASLQHRVAGECRLKFHLDSSNPVVSRPSGQSGQGEKSGQRDLDFSVMPPVEFAIGTPRDEQRLAGHPP